MCENMTPAALEARREYQRQRRIIRKANGGKPRDQASDAIVEAYREYKRRYYAANPEIHKAAQRRYWENKARKGVEE